MGSVDSSKLSPAQTEYMQQALLAYADGELNDAEKATLSASAIRLGLSRETKIEILAMAKKHCEASRAEAASGSPAARSVVESGPVINDDEARNWQEVRRFRLRDRDIDRDDPRELLGEFCQSYTLDTAAVMQTADKAGAMAVLEGAQMFRAFQSGRKVSGVIPCIPRQEYQKLGLILPFLMLADDGDRAVEILYIFQRLKGNGKCLVPAICGILSKLQNTDYKNPDTHERLEGWRLRLTLLGQMCEIAPDDGQLLNLCRDLAFTERDYVVQSRAMCHVLEHKLQHRETILDIVEGWLDSANEDKREGALCVVQTIIIEAYDAGLGGVREIQILKRIRETDPSPRLRRKAADMMEPA